MLIKCPECSKEVSDQSEICIHCGYPLLKNRRSSITEFHKKCPICHNDNWHIDNSRGSAICNSCGFVWIIDEEQWKIYIKLKKEHEQKELEAEQSKNLTKCPKCGCTNIQVVRKKWSLFTGFMTNDTERVCAKCNYRW